jgi:hypothetical protein
LYEGQFKMAKTTFSGPVESLNGFIGAFTSTQIQLQSNNDKVITLDAPSGLAADYTLLLPPNDGDNGQVLTTNGSGVTTWTTNGTGTVSSVDGAGTVNGLTLTGTVTSTGSLTLGGNFALTASAVANLEDIADAINTTNKYTGKMVVVLASGLIFTATGATAADAWNASNGTTVATPV